VYLARTTLGPVDLAFTARYDGARADELDLAIDRPSSALARVVDDFAPGSQVAEMRQVHGPTVLVASPGTVPECDALVTDRTDVTLVVRVADCVPVLLADPHAGVIGAAHAGRDGVAQGVVPGAVERMREQGATDVVAWIGPHVCGACYEVPAAMQDEVGALVPATVSTTRWGTPGLDLGAGVRAQLADAGVRVLTEPDAETCTMEEPRAWSHRRDGASAGRMAGLIHRRARVR
jgi:YfiH family protein